MLWKDRALYGHLLDTFIYQELRRHACWHDDTITFGQFRNKDKVGRDIVPKSKGLLAGVEVEAAATVTGDDSKGLPKLQEYVKKGLQSVWCYRTVIPLYHLAAICMQCPYPAFGRQKVEEESDRGRMEKYQQSLFPGSRQ